MYEGASLTVLWKIASQITRLYKAHINLGPKDIQIALASVLYCDDTLLMTPGSTDTTRCTLLGKSTRSFVRDDPRMQTQAQAEAFCAEIQDFCRGNKFQLHRQGSEFEF